MLQQSTPTFSWNVNPPIDLNYNEHESNVNIYNCSDNRFYLTEEVFEMESVS